MTAVLEVTDIRKNFGGISAVDGVSFEVHEGEILGLIGRTGAASRRSSIASWVNSCRAVAK